MSSLSHIDRLALKSQVSGIPLSEKEHVKWLNSQKGVTFDHTTGTYKFNNQEYNSFDLASKEVYKNNPDAGKYIRSVERYGAFKDTMNSLPSGLGSVAGDLFSGIGSTIGNKFDDNFTAEQQATQSAVRGALNAIPVWGPIISAATGLVDGIGTATGLNLSNIDKDAAERAGVESTATFNNIMNMLPGNSMLWGWMGSRTSKFNKSDLISGLGGAYGGTMGDLDAAENLSEKRVLFGKDKINNYITDAKINQDKLIEINDINSTRLKGITSENIGDYQKQRTSKYQGNSNYAVGKHGMKLLSIDEINRVLNSRKSSDVQEFKNGGVIGIDSNIIPEGKLHAHKHHLNESNPDLEDVTKKGIPIIVVDSEGELQQVAEIEREEIIFRKEVTTKLEELYNDGSEEAMIEAGKLIAEELMTNTDDKTEEFINE